MIPSGPSDLLAIPVQLIYHKRARNSHTSCCTTATLELVDVLMDYLEQLLVEVVMGVRVLEEEREDGAAGVEVVVAFVDQGCDRLFELLGQELLLFNLAVVEGRGLEVLLGRVELTSVVCEFFNYIGVQLVVQTCHKKQEPRNYNVNPWVLSVKVIRKPII